MHRHPLDHPTFNHWAAISTNNTAHTYPHIKGQSITPIKYPLPITPIRIPHIKRNAHNHKPVYLHTHHTQALTIINIDPNTVTHIQTHEILYIYTHTLTYAYTTPLDTCGMLTW